MNDATIGQTGGVWPFIDRAFCKKPPASNGGEFIVDRFPEIREIDVAIGFAFVDEAEFEELLERVSRDGLPHGFSITELKHGLPLFVGEQHY